LKLEKNIKNKKGGAKKLDKKDDKDKDLGKELKHQFKLDQAPDPPEEEMIDEIRALIKEILRREPRRGGVDIIAGSGTDTLKGLLQDIMDGKMKASVHVLGDPGSGTSNKDAMIRKITDCLPCMEGVFAELYFSRKEDRIAYAGYMCLKVLIECMRIDLESEDSETCNMLGVTLDKFCELTGLDKTEHFKGGYHTAKKFR
jgi:hypothetical protein